MPDGTYTIDLSGCNCCGPCVQCLGCGDVCLPRTLYVTITDCPGNPDGCGMAAGNGTFTLTYDDLIEEWYWENTGIDFCIGYMYFRCDGDQFILEVTSGCAADYSPFNFQPAVSCDPFYWTSTAYQGANWEFSCCEGVATAVVTA